MLSPSFGSISLVEGKGSAETFNFVLQSVRRLLKGAEPDYFSSPPPIDLFCSHIIQVGSDITSANQLRMFSSPFQELRKSFDTECFGPGFYP
jgi:hypothetical protein